MGLVEDPGQTSIFEERSRLLPVLLFVSRDPRYPKNPQEPAERQKHASRANTNAETLKSFSHLIKNVQDMRDCT